ncbi:tetraacyldisaccharide 4'-kinase [Chitinophaga horti]|uniref:Tetraacyldisaccharide 4'-kinase n=1 Tax=Chitinophaga horti TaxID=2920382 RepID=A0ABY6J707_9BACT|nr:tetraacyldisaccharide 4'-kinase [Chitinophaga horti]UYQ95275.1 tetraacyldisaccharide 4'-kinase [Chitinophaga horti]
MLRYLSSILYPFSLLYGLIMWVRNRLYDKGVLTAVDFDLPVIAVGNLSVGGTGKTPHVEYLIRLLKDHFRMATLSRGYNRKTKGFYLADEYSTAAEIGDEPMQFHQKFPGISVCVGEERMLAIPQLLMERPYIQGILLDDAFQHRSVKPGKNIMITEYSRPFFRDHVVPFGRLREGRSGYQRADVIIVSKCPDNLAVPEKEQFLKDINPLPHQRVFFTSLRYGALYNMLDGEPVHLDAGENVLVVCGIARPEPLVQHLQTRFSKVYLLPFPDHYYYSRKDLEKMKLELERTEGSPKIIITTEKDAVRLHLLRDIIKELQLPIAVLPVEISFLFNEADSFNNYIFDYVAGSDPIAPLVQE